MQGIQVAQYVKVRRDCLALRGETVSHTTGTV